VVLRLPVQSGAPPVLRSYSLSNLPGSAHYRVTIKQEENGVAGTYLSTRIKAGSNVDAPRQLHTALGQRPGRAVKRGSWRDAGVGDAARLGG
jgi:hypothetical protein